MEQEREKGLYRAIIIVLIAIIGIAIYFARKNRGDYTELVTLNTAMADTLKQYKDKDGLNRARISVLETGNTESFLAIKTIDASIKQLQSDVKANQKYLKNQGSVTNFTTNTKVDTTNPTTVVQTSEPNFPIYKSPFTLKDKDSIWVSGNVVAAKDSTKVSLSIKNSYSVVIGEEPQGFLGLGKPKPFVDVKNLNPFSETTELRTYQVDTPKPKKFHIGVGVFYGVGANFQFQPFLGGGILYDFIKF